jgi:hypothetical protein
MLAGRVRYGFYGLFTGVLRLGLLTTYFLHLLSCAILGKFGTEPHARGPQHMSKRVRQSTYPCRPDDKQQNTTLVTKKIL